MAQIRVSTNPPPPLPPALSSEPPGCVDRAPTEEPAGGRSLADEVYHEVLARIVRGELPGGSELKSTHLADQLGVSRTPVVQALSRLIADGIVTQRMNMRAVVRPGAENWLVEIHELRLLLEPAAAARAAQSMTPEALETLELASAAVAPFADPQWLERARQFDFQLHLTIADHCDNQPLRGAICKCWQYKGLSYELGQMILKCCSAGTRGTRQFSPL